MRRHLLGGLGALLIAAASVSFQHHRLHDPHVVYDRFSLPGFDAYVYVAMAESPGVFTVAPWGYRVLTPALVHAVAGRAVVRGFRWLSLGALTAAGTLLFFYLRRLGHGDVLALVAVAVFGLSAPVAEAIRYPFVGEPLAIALTLGFLLAVEAGSGLGVLSLLLVVGSLSKEVFFLYVPLAVLAERQRRGGRSAAITAAVLPVPALAAVVLLHRWWAPLAPGGEGMVSVMTDPSAFELVVHSWADWWHPLALSGLVPLALLGCFRARSRPFLYRSGYLVPVFLALPLAAAVYPGEGRVVHFFAADVPRLLIYALPFVLALALFGLEGLVPSRLPPSPRLAPPWTDRLALAAAFAVVGALPFILDAYRRVDLRGVRDGPFVLTLCRESLRTARRLERGETVTFELSGQSYVWGESDPGEMARMRWYLRDGWGDKPHYGRGGFARMQGEEATLLIPLFVPRNLTVTLSFEGAEPDRVSLTSSSGAWGLSVSPPPDGEVQFTLPSAVLHRGDNVLRLRGGARAPALRSLKIEAADPTVNVVAGVSGRGE